MCPLRMPSSPSSPLFEYDSSNVAHRSSTMSNIPSPSSADSHPHTMAQQPAGSGQSLEDQFPFLKDETGRKRIRTLLRPDQTKVLNSILSQTYFPSTSVREAAARELGISPRKVQIWFQNVRQKHKRLAGLGGSMAAVGAGAGAAAGEERRYQSTSGQGNLIVAKGAERIHHSSPPTINTTTATTTTTAATGLRRANMVEQVGHHHSTHPHHPRHHDASTSESHRHHPNILHHSRIHTDPLPLPAPSPPPPPPPPPTLSQGSVPHQGRIHDDLRRTISDSPSMLLTHQSLSQALQDQLALETHLQWHLAGRVDEVRSRSRSRGRDRLRSRYNCRDSSPANARAHEVEVTLPPLRTSQISPKPVPRASSPQAPLRPAYAHTHTQAQRKNVSPLPLASRLPVYSNPSPFHSRGRLSEEVAGSSSAKAGREESSATTQRSLAHETRPRNSSLSDDIYQRNTATHGAVPFPLTHKRRQEEPEEVMSTPQWHPGGRDSHCHSSLLRSRSMYPSRPSPVKSYSLSAFPSSLSARGLVEIDTPEGVAWTRRYPGNLSTRGGGSTWSHILSNSNLHRQTDEEDDEDEEGPAARRRRSNESGESLALSSAMQSRTSTSVYTPRTSLSNATDPEGRCSSSGSISMKRDHSATRGAHQREESGGSNPSGSTSLVTVTGDSSCDTFDTSSTPSAPLDRTERTQPIQSSPANEECFAHHSAPSWEGKMASAAPSLLSGGRLRCMASFKPSQTQSPTSNRLSSEVLNINTSYSRDYSDSPGYQGQVHWRSPFPSSLSPQDQDQDAGGGPLSSRSTSISASTSVDPELSPLSRSLPLRRSLADLTFHHHGGRDSNDVTLPPIQSILLGSSTAGGGGGGESDSEMMTTSGSRVARASPPPVLVAHWEEDTGGIKKGMQEEEIGGRSDGHSSQLRLPGIAGLTVGSSSFWSRAAGTSTTTTTSIGQGKA